jgi:hypothetical protein
MFIKNIDEKTLAKKTMINSLKIEESLADILKSESKLIKSKSNSDLSIDEIQKVNRTIKYILYYLIIIDDRIQKCLDLIGNKND